MSRRSGLGAEPTVPLGIKPVLLGDVLVLTTSALDTLNSLPFIFRNWGANECSKFDDLARKRRVPKAQKS